MRMQSRGAGSHLTAKAEGEPARQRRPDSVELAGRDGAQALAPGPRVVAHRGAGYRVGVIVCVGRRGAGGGFGTQMATPAARFCVVGMPMPTPPPTCEP